MKIVSSAALSVLLLASTIHGQGGEYSLNNHHQFLVEPGNLVVEHGLWDYHKYYPKTCDVKFFDLSINPIFKHWKAIDGETSINTYGSFIQGQFNFGDLWLRINTIFGDVKQKHTDNAKQKSHFGIDDVLIKGGYDFYFNGDDHVGLYLLGGFPTKGNLESHIKDDVLHIKTPELGTKHYRVGAGLNGGFTLFDCNEHHLALLGDVQYRYAFPADYTHVLDKRSGDSVKESLKTETRFTPGNTVNGWTALHYAYGNCNFEVGSAFTTTFGHKHETNKLKGKTEIVDVDVTVNKHNSESIETKVETVKNTEVTESRDHVKLPDTVKFGATPYVGFSYNSSICDNPATIGFGVGYDFNELRHEGKPHKFQGVIGWINASLSF